MLWPGSIQTAAVHSDIDQQYKQVVCTAWSCSNWRAVCCAEDDIQASQVPSSEAAAVLKSDAVSSQAQPKAPASGSAAPRTKGLSKQEELASPAAPQAALQQSSRQIQAIPSSAAKESAPADLQQQQSLQSSNGQGASQKRQSEDRVRQGSAGAAVKPEAAASSAATKGWGGNKSFKDVIASGGKADKVGAECAHYSCLPCYGCDCLWKFGLTDQGV